ncbi:Hypothetical_protein [Hexamita inflata]|uniref:Hypothetical_protein n=1 Tax=Hexamita inflata TaxID=28002 RepID=A0AA86RL50_9EUKA|nr:Hypothetical protein HINF_LOCUS61659 [Hexamita inflata]
MSYYSSGLIVNVTQQLTAFELINVQMLGHQNNSENRQLLVLFTTITVSIIINNVNVCSNLQQQYDLLQLSSNLNLDCQNICVLNNFYVYGICTDLLLNGIFSNNTYLCIDPFVFNGSQCVCKEYYVINGSQCINIAQTFSTLTSSIKYINASFDSLSLKVDELYSSVDQVRINLENDINQTKLNLHKLNDLSENYILGNVTSLTQDIQVLDQSIYNNISVINSQLLSDFSSLDQRIYNNISYLNETLSSNSALIYAALAANLNIKDQQIKSLTESLAQITNTLLNTQEQELWFQCQQQFYTFKIYDTTDVTSTINSANFSSNYAFSSSLNIQNVFIDVQSFGASFTLFQTQTTFLNIKVQLNNLTFSSCSLVSQSTSIIINQMSVVSSTETSITVNTGATLNLLQPLASFVNITNLLLNITMSSVSTGSLYLIDTLNGNLYVTGYQILGYYFSTNIVSLGSQMVQDSNIFLNYVQIAPMQFTIGNLSSYLIARVNNSNIKISHVNIQVGNFSINNQLTTISTTSTNYMQFGGLIACQNSTKLQISDIQLILYELISTQFVNSSGQLLGTINAGNSSIYTVCLQYQSLIQNSEIRNFGMIGQVYGILLISMISSQYHYQLIQSLVNMVGMIGIISGITSNMINIDSQMTIKQNQGQSVGVVSGCIVSNSWSAQNITVKNSYLTGNFNLGLFTTRTSQGSIISSSFSSSYLNSSNLTYSIQGGMIAETLSNIFVQQCIINNITMFSNNTFGWSISGGLIGDAHNFNTIIQQTAVKSSDIQSYGLVTSSASSGGLVAWIYNTILLISDVQITNIILKAQSYTGSVFVASMISFNTCLDINVVRTQIKQIQIVIKGTQIYSGIIFAVGSAGSTIFTFSQTNTEGSNTINGAQITNCENVVFLSETGC